MGERGSVRCRYRCSRSLLPDGAMYVDLPDFDLDFLRTHTAEFAALLDATLPPD